MLVYLEGFDGIATADLTAGPTPPFTSISAATVQTTTKRTGTGALSITSPSGYAVASGLGNHATFGLGVGLYIANVAAGTGTTPIIVFGEGSLVFPGAGAHVSLSVNGSGALLLHGGRDLGEGGGGTLLATSTNVLSSATWYHVEIVVTIANSGGTVEVFVNGSKANWIDFTGDTQNTANAYVNAFGFSGNGAACIYDDVFAWGGTGGVRTSRLGDLKVLQVDPDANGATNNFTPSAGTNYQNVDDGTPDGDTTYNESSSVGNIDLYSMADLSGVGTIYGVKVSVTAKKTDATTADVQPVLRVGGTNYLQTQRGAGTSYGEHADILETSPATSVDFTAAELNAGNVGLKHAA